MIKFLIYAAIVLVFLFILILIGSAMLWVILKLLRSLFPQKFQPHKARNKDEK
mgnify:CR=1 FL=1